VILVGGISVGWVSGGAFNPAVALGATIVGVFTWSHLWIYAAADLAGGVLAATAFLALRTEEHPAQVIMRLASRDPGASS